MKKVLMILMLTAGSMSYAQLDPTTLPEATCTADYCVQLDASQPVAEFYKIDIASFDFASFDEAHAQFGRISNNLLTYKVDMDEQLVILQVHLDRTEEPENIIWWNNYLNTLCGL